MRKILLILMFVCPSTNVMAVPIPIYLEGYAEAGDGTTASGVNFGVSFFIVDVGLGYIDMSSNRIIDDRALKERYETYLQAKFKIPYWYELEKSSIQPFVEFGIFPFDSNPTSNKDVVTEDSFTSIGVTWFPRKESLKVGINFFIKNYDIESQNTLTMPASRDVSGFNVIGIGFTAISF